MLTAYLCSDLYVHTLYLDGVSLRKGTELTIFNYSVIFWATLSAAFVRKKIANCLSRAKGKYISSRDGISLHRSHSVNWTISWVPVLISSQSVIEQYQVNSNNIIAWWIQEFKLLFVLTCWRKLLKLRYDFFISPVIPMTYQYLGPRNTGELVKDMSPNRQIMCPIDMKIKALQRSGFSIGFSSHILHFSPLKLKTIWLLV